jgi:hypothetical protein
MSSRGLFSNWVCTLPIFITLLSATLCLAESIQKDLGAFSSILVCAPLNVLLVPSKHATKMVSIEGDLSATSNIRATVSGSQLSIETVGSIDAKRDIKVTVQPSANFLPDLEGALL